MQKNPYVIKDKNIKPRWLVNVCFHGYWSKPFLSNFFISRCSLAFKIKGSWLLTCSRPRATRSWALYNRIVSTRPMHLTTFRVNIWGYFIPTLINRVNIYCFQYHESCIQVLYHFGVVRKWLIQLTTFRINIWVHFNPTLINRVKYIILYSWSKQL